jgi:hypothetical protein
VKKGGVWVFAPLAIRVKVTDTAPELDSITFLFIFFKAAVNIWVLYSWDSRGGVNPNHLTLRDQH